MINQINRREALKAMTASVAFLAGVGAGAHAADPHEASKERAMGVEFKVPGSLKVEHEELHEELAKATKAGGKTGEAAQAVAKVLHPHFVKEEEFAMPPLSLLPALSEGKVTAEMNQVLVLSDRLKKELPAMLEEHQAIVAALRKLEEAAKTEGQPQAMHLAEKLRLHARTEEEVLYPAAVLVGDYLKLKLKK